MKRSIVYGIVALLLVPASLAVIYYAPGQGFAGVLGGMLSGALLKKSRESYLKGD